MVISEGLSGVNSGNLHFTEYSTKSQYYENNESGNQEQRKIDKKLKNTEKWPNIF